MFSLDYIKDFHFIKTTALRQYVVSAYIDACLTNHMFRRLYSPKISFI